jgi:hypothetical protein
VIPSIERGRIKYNHLVKEDELNLEEGSYETCNR